MCVGLVPWELMFLDQTLTTIHSNEIASQTLVKHTTKVSAWFTHYSKEIEISLFSSPGKSRQAMSAPLMSSPSSFGDSSNFNTNARQSFGLSSQGHIIDAPEMMTFRGITYKSLSKFFRDYGVIPYLIKDAQLFRYSLHFTLSTMMNMHTHFNFLKFIQ
jgi:hypothetical protein